MPAASSYQFVASGTTSIVEKMKEFYEGYVEDKNISTDLDDPTTVSTASKCVEGHIIEFVGQGGSRPPEHDPQNPPIIKEPGSSVSFSNGSSLSIGQPYEVSGNTHYQIDVTMVDCNREARVTTVSYEPIPGRESQYSTENVYFEGLYLDRNQASTLVGAYSLCSYYNKSTGVFIRKTCWGMGGVLYLNSPDKIVDCPKSQEAAIDLQKWNSSSDFLDSIIDSGGNLSITPGGDSYTQASDPDELADNVLDAITDNGFEGSFAETAVPSGVATTVEEALDDLDDKISDTSAVDVISTIPATTSSTGTVGQVAYDSTYIYVCTATNTWRRAALGSW